MTLNSCLRAFFCPRAGITGVYYHTKFTKWNLQGVEFGVSESALSTESHPQTNKKLLKEKKMYVGLQDLPVTEMKG